MKIEVVTFSSNEKSEYTRFWEPMSKHLKNNLGLHPVLLYCGKDKTDDITDKYGDVHHIYCGEKYPTYIPSIWGYFWVTSLYPEKVCITSGIDMCIFDINYFNKRIENLIEDSYVVSNGNGYVQDETQFLRDPRTTAPSYYHIAKGKTFKQVLQFDDNFLKEVEKFNRLDYSNKYNGYSTNPASFLQEACVNNGGKWCLDEMYSSDLMKEYNKKTNKIVPQRMGDAPRYTLYDTHKIKSIEGQIVDIHFGKPYSTKEQIDSFIDRIFHRTYN
jgi:hypothetical protein